MDLSKLKQPFPANKIHWRVGATNGEKTSGIAFGYIDARNVMERLDEVFGVAGWQCEYPFPGCCRIGIRVSVGGDSSKLEWVWKSNGAGTTDVEAEKGQYSDSFKRAAVLLNIGQYLYDLPNKWFPIEKAGLSYKFSDQTIKELNERYTVWVEQYFKKQGEE